MKILYDHQVFSLQDWGGISRYFTELMKNFRNEENVEIELPLWYSNNVHLSEVPGISARKFFPYYRFRGRNRIIFNLNEITGRKFLRSGRFDLFHPTYYDHRFLNIIRGKPFVLTVHDMTYEMYPHLFRGSEKIIQSKKVLLENAGRVIAVSEHTRNDILNFYPINPEKIKVIYLGNSLWREDLSAGLSPSLPLRYLLYVGNREGHKNFSWMIQALSPLLHGEKDLFLVCAGGGSLAKGEMDLLRRHKIVEKVHQYPVTDPELIQLYSNATAFVFPSLYEGFGIPVLEAFGCGCPAALSNRSSLPEVGDDAALYFNPEDENSIREAVSRLLKDHKLREDLINKGRERVKEFTWKNTARETLQVYHQALEDTN